MSFRVLVLASSLIPSVVIGIIRPLMYLTQSGEVSLRVRHSRFRPARLSDYDWCDIAVFCRSCDITDLRDLYQLKLRKKKVVFEIDDNFQQIPLTSSVAIYHRAFYRLYIVKRFYELSDLTRVYSSLMFQQVLSHGGKPTLINSYFDTSIINNIAPTASSCPLKIVYATSRPADVSLEGSLFDAVAQILKRYRGSIEFHLWRDEMPESLQLVDGVVLKKRIRNYERYLKVFYREGYQIGLAPGVSHPFFSSKTNNKYRELAGSRVAGIYSNVPPYSDCVTHCTNGLLVGNSSNDWFVAIELLVNNHLLRSRIIDKAFSDITCHYSFANSLNDWRDALQSVAKVSHQYNSSLFSPRASRLSFQLVSLTSFRDFRVEFFESALGSLSLSTVAYHRIFNSLSSYLEARLSGRPADIVFLLIDSLNFLPELTQVVELSVNIVIDISCCHDGDEHVVNGILEALKPSETVPKWVIRPSQKSLFPDPLFSEKSPYVVVVNQDSASLSHYYSLDGYPAAYMSLCDMSFPLSGAHLCSPAARATARVRFYCSVRLQKVRAYIYWLDIASSLWVRGITSAVKRLRAF